MKTRRQFISAAAAAVSAPAIMPAAIFGAEKKVAANERITMGMIGVGGRGFANMDAFLKLADVQVVAVCDVDTIHYGKHEGRKGRAYGRDAAKTAVEGFYAKQKGGSFKGCEAYSDYRELCARDDIDAVLVATPDNWHALAGMEALKNGKDVYCEKPVTHLFAEGQALYQEVAKRKAIFQTGSQQRSTANFHQAVELIQNEVIGKVKRVEVGLPKGHNEPLGDIKNHTPPEHLDYGFWTGPSEMLPYMKARSHWNWRWHLAYGGGQLMDWIGHHNDINHWAIGMDKSGPQTVEAIGWTYPETKVYNSPVDYEVRCTYAGGIETSIGSVNPMGTKWIGENGWVHVTRGKLTASNPEWVTKEFKPGPKRAYKAPEHHRNFIDGVKTRTECVAPAETAHRSITPGHIAYVSQALGRKLKWDPAKEEVIGDPEAQEKLMALPYRAPWKLS